MLSDISIRNVVLIERLDLELGSGLSALTGETGAGKSIILDALGMATGARSDRGLVRPGTDRAQCSATFELPAHHSAKRLAAEADIRINSGEPLVLRRTISADGRSRAYVNDVPVSVKLLSGIGSELLEVHGQNNGRGLLDPNQHIHMLDEFGGHGTRLSACRSVFQARRSAGRRLENLAGTARAVEENREFLIHAIEELDRLDPHEGEESRLAERRKFLQGVEAALAELDGASNALSRDGGFDDRLSTALAGVERVRNKIGEGDADAAQALGRAAEALETALIETEEARQAVETAALAFDVAPQELEDMDGRFFALRSAARKYGVEVDALCTQRDMFARELRDIETLEGALKQARAELDEATRTYDVQASALTRARQATAEKLEHAVMNEVPALRMEQAEFKVQIEPAAPSGLGQDRIRFLASTNPGMAPGALDRIASGGELARFALAIKVALAGEDGKVMAFDEVDQGVGGAVASAVGKRLSELSKSGQVLVVTHSPQVAAHADCQFRIEKSSIGGTTTADVFAVSDSEREHEIARMLAGETVTDEAVAAARQLMRVS
ncbi:MAG: DNA repair protein RecN [Hyphomonadaceae bacterium]|nr:DNA repair protein RecN [Hyphomonadaceae bacterium]MBC6412124.1 DNA repair protein RecN [Hyphomonadaceae bacterium]